jgi:hypothetical protein
VAAPIAATRLHDSDGLAGDEHLKMMATIYSGFDPDPIGDRANAALTAIKAQCSKELRPGLLAVLLFIRPEHMEQARGYSRRLWSKLKGASRSS